MSFGFASWLAARIAQYGWIAKGIVFFVIGLLGIELARQGYAGESADQTGALAAMSGVFLGRLLVLIVGAGLTLFSMWQIWSAFESESQSWLDWIKRVGSVGLGVTYGLLAATAIRAGFSGDEPTSDGSGPASPDGVATFLMGLPLGRALVAVVGVGIGVVGAYHLQKGWRAQFLEDIETDDLEPKQTGALRWMGIAGFTARSVMLGVAATMFILAAWRFDPDQAAGLDQSLRTLLELPAGRILIGTASIGLMLAGAYDAVTFNRQRLE